MSCRPLSGQWPGFESPFCALPVAVHLHDRGVDHGIFQVWLVRGSVKEPSPHISPHPVAEARERRAPVAEVRWEIPPGASRPHDPQHRLHKQPVVAAAAARVPRLAETVRLHLRPLGIGQNESVHPELESHTAAQEKPNSQQALDV